MGDKLNHRIPTELTCARGTSRMKVRAAADGELVTRDYRPTDDQRIAEIVKLAWPHVTVWKKLEDEYGWRGSKPWWRYKLDPVLALGKESPRQLIVAEWNGAVVGYATYIVDPGTRIGQVLDNAVDPACGGKGIGSTMHREILRRMREDGMELAKVGTGLDENQAAARRLYEKHGFKEMYREVICVRRLDDLEF